MRKLLVVLALVLVVPSVAIAGTASHAKAPQVMYVLKGTLMAFTAANGATNGSVSILVKSSNHHGASLKGQTLTFPVSSSTKVVTEGGTVTVNDNGIVKVRGPKKIGPTDNLATVLQALTAKQVIDQGTTG